MPNISDPYGQGVTWLDYTETPDLKVMGDSIAIALTGLSNMVFESATERDATLTSPTEGMEAFLLDQQAKTLFSGGAWRRLSFTTAWVELGLNPTFWTNYGDYPMPRVRRVGDIVYLEGRAARVDGQDIPNQSGQGFSFIGNVPSGFRAPSVTYAEGYAGITNAGSGAPLGRIEIAGTAAPGGDYHNPGDIRFYKDKSSHWVSLHAYWHMA